MFLSTQLLKAQKRFYRSLTDTVKNNNLWERDKLYTAVSNVNGFLASLNTDQIITLLELPTETRYFNTANLGSIIETLRNTPKHRESFHENLNTPLDWWLSTTNKDTLEMLQSPVEAIRNLGLVRFRAVLVMDFTILHSITDSHAVDLIWAVVNLQKMFHKLLNNPEFKRGSRKER